MFAQFCLRFIQSSGSWLQPLSLENACIAFKDAGILQIFKSFCFVLKTQKCD